MLNKERKDVKRRKSRKFNTFEENIYPELNRSFQLSHKRRRRKSL
jgi:hypothetical protein